MCFKVSYSVAEYVKALVSIKWKKAVSSQLLHQVKCHRKQPSELHSLSELLEERPQGSPQFVRR